MQVPSIHTLLAALLALVTLPGCQALTEIMVSMNTDMEIPTQVDAIGMTVYYLEKDRLHRISDNTWRVDPADPHATSLPATLGLLPGEDPHRLLEVKVAAYRSGREALERRARLNFVSGRVLLLRMHLLDGCLGVRCSRDQTCGENGCEPIIKNANDLPEYQIGGISLAVNEVQPDDAGLKPPFPTGVLCANSGQCQSGHCEDGICCATACAGDCMECNLSGNQGTFSPAPADSSCTSDRQCQDRARCINGRCVSSW